MGIRFIADNNVGKLAKWLRIIGYDTLFFKEKDDNKMFEIALNENRVILTRDTQLMKRRLVTKGKLRAMLIEQDSPKAQLQKTIKNLALNYFFNPFSLCLECNQALISRGREEVQKSVPPYVFKTQNQYRECPLCHRIYWQGTHWQRMIKELNSLTTKGEAEDKGRG